MILYPPHTTFWAEYVCFVRATDTVVLGMYSLWVPRKKRMSPLRYALLAMGYPGVEE